MFINSYGGIEVLELEPDERATIDNIHFVAMDGTVKWNARKLGEWKSFLFGGEGLVLDVAGPARVWVQTRTLPTLAQLISKFLPDDDDDD